MTGIDKITARIESDARKEAEAILSEADERCEEIRTEYEKLAQEEYWKLIRAGVKDCEARVKLLASTAEMEAKKRILSMKQEMVARAFVRAVELILSRPVEEYAGFLAHQAARAAVTGTEEIILNSKDRESCGRKVVRLANDLLNKRGIAGKLTLSYETRPMAGGVILKQGGIETNCSIEALIETYRNELSAPVANVLFDS
ncbi:MAG: V-type ATP synthase subunit E [Oscillospiraceae bacterium]|jgi:V/A-type H+-transporting ATPase subunit E